MSNVLKEEQLTKNYLLVVPFHVMSRFLNIVKVYI